MIKYLEEYYIESKESVLSQYLDYEPKRKINNKYINNTKNYELNIDIYKFNDFLNKYNLCIKDIQSTKNGQKLQPFVKEVRSCIIEYYFNKRYTHQSIAECFGFPEINLNISRKNMNQIIYKEFLEYVKQKDL
jgi:hypothetical protein